ncbi:MAG: M23 family metallopeptidase [Bacteroidales bacterium]|nr:M23 family metallopeptidase [Bacteroidales bacterium]
MNLKQWWTRLRSRSMREVMRHKHKFVVMDTNTFKEKFSFELTGSHLFVALGIAVIVLIALTTVLIAFTPLRELIPGYTNARATQLTYDNAQRVDSLEVRLEQQEWMVRTMRAVLVGEDLGREADSLRSDTLATLPAVAKAYRRSKEDSLLRLEVEREDSRYQVKAAASPATETTPAIMHLFFAPLKGKVLKPYSPSEKHYGVDITGAVSQPVHAAYSGTVVSASFTADAGYVVSIQHPGNVISVYRNLGTLLKRQGDAVRAAEPLGYVGNAGLREQGPYLHFELWVNGSPVNPTEYISF